MGVAGREADREGDEARVGDAGWDAVRVGKNQRLDDRAVVDGATAAARAERKRGTYADPENPSAIDALSRCRPMGWD